MSGFESDDPTADGPFLGPPPPPLPRPRLRPRRSKAHDELVRKEVSAFVEEEDEVRSST